ncbi:hypothetical protein MishRS11D_42480 (plasmid) [Methylomagnum ishizawai]|nr:hypothetical protein MishRS11D_42480 [Methylomagnum ishizawai]
MQERSRTGLVADGLNQAIETDCVNRAFDCQARWQRVPSPVAVMAVEKFHTVLVAADFQAVLGVPAWKRRQASRAAQGANPAPGIEEKCGKIPHLGKAVGGEG